MNHYLPLRNKLIIMGSVMASLFLVALDQTIISTAMGKIVEEFNAFSQLGWIVTAYMLTTTVTVPIAGKLSDLFGRRIMLMIGVAIFLVGSLLSGAAGSIDMLIWSRALQGIGGGIITANAFTIIGDLFVARERGKWQGLIGATFGLSSLIGPLLGGFLTESHQIAGLTTDWRWTFYINVPIALIAFAIIAIFCPPLKHDSHKPRIDYAGATLLTVALATLVLAVDNTQVIFHDFLQWSGWSLEGLRVLMWAVVAATVAGFVAVERRSKEPIIPMEFFRHKNYVLIVTLALMFGGAFLGAILYVTQFNQQVYGASPTTSGLMILPLVAGLMVSSIGMGQAISRTGRYKWPMIIGIGVAACAMAGMTMLRPEMPYWQEAVMLVFLGAGFGVVMPVMNLVVQSEFSIKQLGVATSSTQLFRGLGSTVGVAIFGAVLTGGMTTHASDIHATNYIKTIEQSPAAKQIGDLNDTNTLITLNSPDIQQKIRDNFTESTKSAPPAVRTKLTDQFTASQQEFSDKVTHAFSESLRPVFVTSALMLAVAFILATQITEKKLRSATDTDTPS
jgi:EmrB/QacA subfamily drug resistance transporter